MTNFQDAQAAVDAGASAIGLNFYQNSRRFITPATAHQIRKSLTDDIEIVGVFVNSSADDVANVVRQVGLSAVQFHGDESHELVAQFHREQPRVPIIRAYRVGKSNADSVLEDIHSLCRLVPLTAILVDADVAGQFGGTGQQPDQSAVKLLVADPQIPPLILAGGLTADNVATAVRAVGPWGVDTASGVESEPAIKDPELVRRFIQNAGGTQEKLPRPSSPQPGRIPPP